MTSYSLDFNGVEPAGNFEPLAEGVYELKIDSAKVEESKTGKEPSLKLVFIPVDHPTQKIWHNLYLGEASRPWVLQFLIGVYGADKLPKQIELDDEFCSGLTGENVIAAVEIDGKYNKITSFEEAPF